MKYEGRDSRSERRRKARRNFSLVILTGLLGGTVVVYVLWSVNRSNFSLQPRKFPDIAVPGRR